MSALAELFIYAGGKWRALDYSEGFISVEGWKKRSDTLLAFYPTMLRQVSASALNSIRKGTPLSKKRRKQRPAFKFPSPDLYDYYRYKENYPTRATSLKDVSIQTSLPNSSTSRNDGVLQVRPDNVPPRKIPNAKPIVNRPVSPEPVKKVTESQVQNGSDTNVVEHSTETEKRDMATQRDHNDQFKELVINEDDVMALRNYILNNETGIDLHMFDADDTYKATIFYKINPLVRIEYSAQMEKMIRDRETRSMLDFAHGLGLQSVNTVRISSGSDFEDVRALKRKIKRNRLGRFVKSKKSSLPTKTTRYMSDDKTSDTDVSDTDADSYTTTESTGTDMTTNSYRTIMRQVAKKCREELVRAKKKHSKKSSRRTVPVNRYSSTDYTNTQTVTNRLNNLIYPEKKRRDPPINKTNDAAKETGINNGINNGITKQKDSGINNTGITKQISIKSSSSINLRHDKRNDTKITNNNKTNDNKDKSDKVVTSKQSISTTTNINSKKRKEDAKKSSDVPESLKILRKAVRMPKRSSVPPGREYSSLEDHSIVSWLSAGQGRERAVNGNRIWRELELMHQGITGQKRSWHSLRNRFLRYILPNLSALALPSHHAQRLRANAAQGELKVKRRNSLLLSRPGPAGAHNRRPKDRDEGSSRESRTPEKRLTRMSSQHKNEENQLTSRTGSPSKNSSQGSPSKRPTRLSLLRRSDTKGTPKDQKVTKSPVRMTRSSKTSEPETDNGAPPQSKRRRLFNPLTNMS